METLREQARVVNIVACEAVEETDVIERRPEVIDVLIAMSENGVGPALRKVAPAEIGDPPTYLRDLAEALRPYRDAPMDDAPELVERLAYVAQALNQLVSESASPVPAS